MTEEVLYTFKQVYVQQEPGSYKKDIDVEILKIKENSEISAIFIRADRYLIPLTKKLLVLKESKLIYKMLHKDVFIIFTFPST